MPKFEGIVKEEGRGDQRRWSKAEGAPKYPVIDAGMNANFFKGLNNELRDKHPAYKLFTYVTYRDDRPDKHRISIRVTPKHKAAWIIFYRPTPGASERTHKLADYDDLSHEQAVEMAKEARQAIAEGRHPRDAYRKKVKLDGPTLSECLEFKVEKRGLRPERPKGLAPATVDTHRKHMKRIRSYGLADVTMARIKSSEIMALHDAIPRDIQSRGAKRGDGYATAAKVINLINELYLFAIKNYETDDIPPKKIITHNPCDSIKANKIVGSDHRERRASDRSISQSDLQRFWITLESLKDYVPDRYNKEVKSNIIGQAYLKFQLLTGMRGGSLSNLKFRMYDTKYKEFVIKGDDKFLMKTKSEFILPLPDEAAEIVDQMRAHHGNISEYVFCTVDGDTGVQIGVPDWVNWVRDRSQIDFTSHGLRSTFITCAESCSVPINIYKQLVDHGNQPQDITSRYTRSEIEIMRGYSQLITDFILFNAGVKKKPEDPVFKANDNPFNIKEQLHNEIEELASVNEKTVKDMYEQCIKLGTLAHKYPHMQAKDLLSMITLL